MPQYPPEYMLEEISRNVPIKNRDQRNKGNTSSALSHLGFRVPKEQRRECMTKSLTKEPFTPYEEPERVLHSTRKLFKTTSLDYSSLPEFDLFFNPEDQFKEEVPEAMGEPTMEEYITITQINYESGNEKDMTEKKFKKFYPPSRTGRKTEANGANTKFEWDPTNIEFENWAFKEFNYLSQIDVDVLTKDIPGFETYEEDKDDWIYEWNNGIPWVNEKP
nr:hypothetical protein [Tanacetum cinerariifolium]